MIKSKLSYPEDQNKIVILFVDDVQNNLNSFTTYFKRNKKYLILTANSAREALSILKIVSVQIIVSNQNILKVTGVEFLKESIKKTSELIKIFVTVDKDVSPVPEIYNDDLIFQFLKKPKNLKDLEQLIDEIYYKFEYNRGQERDEKNNHLLTN